MGFVAVAVADAPATCVFGEAPAVPVPVLIGGIAKPPAEGGGGGGVVVAGAVLCNAQRTSVKKDGLLMDR